MKKLPWFRMYVDFLEDPKIIGIAFEDQRHFIGVLAMKSSGILDQECRPEMLDRIIAQKLWIDYAIIRDVKRRLVDANLIGEDWQPLGWEKRQYPSDSSYERVKRHREKRAAEGLPQQNYINPRKRQQVYDRDGNACVYCGSSDDLTLDHDIPQSMGGSDEVDNLVTACRPCNASKRDMTGDEFRKREMKRFSNAADREEDTERETDKKTKAPGKPARFDPLQIELPSCIPADAWKEWIAYRRSRKLTVSEKTMKAQVAKLAEWHAAGHQPADIISTSITNGWQGLFEPKTPASGRTAARDERSRAHYDRSADTATMMRQIEQYNIKPYDGEF